MGNQRSNGKTNTGSNANHAFRMRHGQCSLLLLKPTLARRNIRQNSAEHNRNGAEIAGRNSLHGSVEVLQGAGVLLLAVLERGGHLRRGLHVLGDDGDGELGLVGAGLNGGLEDVHQVEILAEEWCDGGDTHVRVVRVGADILNRVVVGGREIVFRHRDGVAS